MNLPTLDKALVLLLVLELVAVTNGVARADPPPSSCDSYCRERRYFKAREPDGNMSCIMMKYRWCHFCNSTASSCMANVVTDLLTDGTCKEQNVKEAAGSPVPKTCDAMCPFPQQAGTFTAEAAEAQDTYTNVTTWVDLTFNVKKCFKEGQPYKEWSDEDVKWNTKKEE